MAKFSRRSSCPQLQSMRARWFKARGSCVNDDSYDEGRGQEEEEGGEGRQQQQCNGQDISEPTMTQPRSRSDSSSQTTTTTTTTTQQHPGPDPEQQQSAFFGRLPAEVRRMIYTELFRATSPLMKTHVHAACDSARLIMTPCCYVPKATYSTRDDEVDPMLTDPWPGWRGRNQPPRWFWHAWGLRLRWGPHWKCQAAAMLDWKAKGDGTCVDLRAQRSGWWGLLLSCKRMYTEAIECFFESTELIFTSSEDAHRFFIRNGHGHLGSIRSLDMDLIHFKDHLFLQRIEAKHPQLPNSHNSAPVAWQMWTPLALCIRESLVGLCSLRMHIAPPSLKGEMFFDALRTWERDGHGWVEEQADGVVYMEKHRSRAARSCPDQQADSGLPWV